MIKKSDKKTGIELEIPQDLMDAAVAAVDKAKAAASASADHNERAERADRAATSAGSTGEIAPSTHATVTVNSNDGEKGEYYDRLVRVSADFDNFRKRYHKEKLESQKYGAESFVRAFLPTIDNLERAVRQCPEGEATMAMCQGLRLLLDQMLRDLNSSGVTSFDPTGQPFDPLLHEAIATQETSEVPPQTVVQAHQRGFKLWDRLLRPARVTVSIPVTTETTSDKHDRNKGQN